MRVLRPIERRPQVDSDRLPRTLHPTLRRIYASRGALEAIDVALDLARMVPIGRLKNIEAAVDLVLRHRKGRVLVVGDFDADGATSTALVLRCLRRYGFDEVNYLVPNRFDFGYGLSHELAGIAVGLEPTLIITVDNGISSIRGVRRAMDSGVDVLITDHHLPPGDLPAASVILNPNMPGDPYSSKALAGVGVAFCLMAALGRRLEADGEAGAARIAAEYLDLVALGTVADVVPLDRNNRILVNQGLKRIRAGRTVPGVLALIADAGRDYRRAGASDLGFAVGPRLNAAGRLEDMAIGIEALLTESPGEARELAMRLGEINRERRQIEASMQNEALVHLETLLAGDTSKGGLPTCLALHDPDWHQGVVGLIASRVKERTHRPVFAFARSGENELKGSGRSIQGVHLRDLLAWMDARWPDMITRFGGHAMAAGLTLSRTGFGAFSRRVVPACAELFPQADFDGCWLTDGALEAQEIDVGFAEALRAAGPWGQSFDEPLFDGRFTLHSSRVVADRHLKMRVRPAGGTALVDAIAFGHGDLGPLPGGIDTELVYRLDVNEYRGIRTAQLIVEQLRLL